MAQTEWRKPPYIIYVIAQTPWPPTTPHCLWRLTMQGFFRPRPKQPNVSLLLSPFQNTLSNMNTLNIFLATRIFLQVHHQSTLV
jgi:hypothetical protein